MFFSFTGYLYKLTDKIVKSMSLGTNGAGEQEFLKVITKPFTHLIIQVTIILDTVSKQIRDYSLLFWHQNYCYGYLLKSTRENTLKITYFIRFDGKENIRQRKCEKRVQAQRL